MVSFKNYENVVILSAGVKNVEKQKLLVVDVPLEKIRKEKTGVRILNDNVIKFPKKFKGKKVPKIVDLDDPTDCKKI